MPPKCSCEEPREHVDPRRKGWCGSCLRQLDPAWLSTDETVREFFGRLEAGSFPGAVPETFKSFRRHCEVRELAGRDSFGLGYLARDNCAEAQEEAVDALLYAFLDSLKMLREAGADDDFDLVLMVANYSYKAYEATARLAAKRRGSP